MIATLVLLAALSATPAPPSAPAATPAPGGTFGPAWNALVGSWTAEGEAGSSGASSFRIELEGRVLVRRSTADYPASEGRPAVHHEDLLVFHSPAGGSASADYWDNEGHVIRYAASWSADGKVLTLVSDAVPGSPRFRLVYAFPAPDRATVSFDIAPPGSETFRKYVGGDLRKAPVR